MCGYQDSIIGEESYIMKTLKAVVSAEGRERILRMQGGACWTCRVDFALLKAYRRLSPCYIRPPLENEAQREGALPLALCQVCVGTISTMTFKTLKEMGEFVEKYGSQMPLTKSLTGWRTLADAWPVPGVAASRSNPQGLRETAEEAAVGRPSGEIQDEPPTPPVEHIEIVPPSEDVIPIVEQPKTVEETEVWKLVQTLRGKEDEGQPL